MEEINPDKQLKAEAEQDWKDEIQHKSFVETKLQASGRDASHTGTQTLVSTADWFIVFNKQN